ncbi:MAG: LamG domain-containing protein, partial [Candidatus Edwardsbacteria bacterium]|nr:LamG domain-containing protein [Candidatus Edwardsbacteria bacterium]
MGGGGGGSSYVSGTGVTNGLMLQANGAVQANSIDSLNLGTGAGGAPSTNGVNGKAVISYTGYSGNNDGAPAGTTVVNGISGKARYFDGTNDIITAEGTNLPTGNSSRSISAWVKTSTLSGDRTIAGWGPSSDSQANYINLYTNYFRFIGWGNDLTGPANVQTGQWYFVAATHDGTTARLYVNGAEVASGSKTLNTTKTRVNIGNYSGYISPFNGVIDEVHISSVARTAEEIAEAYRAGRDHYINKTISSTDLSAKTTLPFYVASDRQGTFLQATIGESAFANYQPDVNTAGQWHLDDATPFSATGGTVTYSGGYTIHTFTTGGTFTPNGVGTVDVLVVGGGGGGANTGSGGGAGGYVYQTGPTVNAQTYTVSVGSGGTSPVDGSPGTGQKGGNSVFSTITAEGGGGGISHGGGNGMAGGSGSGGTVVTAAPTPTGGSASAGNAGGAGYVDAGWVGTAGGGGGAGSVGGAGGNAAGVGNGGAGAANSISGASVTYAAGGGAGEVNGSFVGTGGSGIGGSGTLNSDGTAGTVNTGSGGGGGSYNGAGPVYYHTGGTGGSGIVIIRYPTSETTVKDSSGNGNNGGTNNPALVQGKIGKARSFNGTSDYVIVPNSSSLQITTYTVETWIKPIVDDDYWTGIVGKPGRNFNMWFGNSNTSSGFIHHRFHDSANTNSGCPDASGVPIDGNTWTYIVLTNDGTTCKTYFNGVLQVSGSVTESLIVDATDLQIGRNLDGGASNYFRGSIDEVRISNTARTADQIRQAYEVGARTHNITIDFKAALNSGNLIANTSDLSFTIDATAFGATSMGSNLYLGDKIIVKENYDGTEYLVQGTVNAVTSSTGAASVAAWDTGSTVPSGGFTVNATVFKWQREYFDLRGSLSTHRDAVTNLTLRVTDGSQGANIWLD